MVENRPFVTWLSHIVLIVGLIRGRTIQRVVVPILTAATLVTAIVLTLWVWDPGVRKPIINGALSIDTLALGLSMLFYVSGLATILLSYRSDAVRQVGGGEYYSLMLGSIAGMVVLAADGDGEAVRASQQGEHQAQARPGEVVRP